jgi:hypothetical protein
MAEGEKAGAVNAGSTRRPDGLNTDINVEARIPLGILKKLFFAVTGAEIILPIPVSGPELCRILIDDCKTDRIRSHSQTHPF